MLARNFFRSIPLLFSVVASVSCGGPKTDLPVYLDESKPIDERVEDALARMTLEEKVSMIHAQSKFSSKGVPRLGIPELWTDDGPHGVRPEVFWDEWSQAGWTNDSCTAFPALTCLAATWNPDMAALYGKSVGEEARFREKDVLLGPGVNIYRTPLNGRNFEYMGEDPYLASRIVVPYVQNLQKNGVAACVKHFALNNQESHRHSVNVTVDDRALREIYLPAFKAAVQEGGAWSIMGSYNLYKGQHCCHNEYLLNDILKKEWGFDGVVISDWGGTYNTDQAANNGLDLEFGTGTDGLSVSAKNAYDKYYMAFPYLAKLRSGELPVSQLDDKVRRVLKLNFRTAMNTHKPFGSMNSPEHLDAARQIGGEGIVLLKNENNVLPLDLEKTGKILVVGENAIKMMTVGGGSSSLKVQHEVLPLEGLVAAAGDRITYERGYVGDISGTYDGVTSGQNLSESRSKDQLIEDAVKAAGEADAVIFIGGLNKGVHQDCEGQDRLQYGLPYAQDMLIEALAAANSNLAVLLVSGNAVAMPWIDKVPAVAQVWFLGSQAGNIIADVVFGKVNPSGKLPFSFPVRLEDNAAHALGAYNAADETEYKESIFVGYRWFDTKNIKPLFAFGHGLSYTTFEYSNVRADKASMTSRGAVKVSVDVKNTGDRAGKEVVQMYIGDQESSLPRPVKELKGFKKVSLQPGETVTVTFDVTPEMLQFYDDRDQCWKAEPGMFTVYVGAASDDIRGTADFELR